MDRPNLLPASDQALKGFARLIYLNPSVVDCDDFDGFSLATHPAIDIVETLAAFAEEKAADMYRGHACDHFLALGKHLVAEAEKAAIASARRSAKKDEIDVSEAMQPSQTMVEETRKSLLGLLETLRSPALENEAYRLAARAIASAADFLSPKQEKFGERTYDDAESAQAYFAGLSEALREGGDAFLPLIPDLVGLCPRYTGFAKTSDEEEVARGCFHVARPLLQDPSTVMLGIALALKGADTSYKSDRYEAEGAILDAFNLVPAQGAAADEARKALSSLKNLAKNEGDAMFFNRIASVEKKFGPLAYAGRAPRAEKA